jgi:hypothetical protein
LVSIDFPSIETGEATTVNEAGFAWIRTDFDTSKLIIEGISTLAANASCINAGNTVRRAGRASSCLVYKRTLNTIKANT